MAKKKQKRQKKPLPFYNRKIVVVIIGMLIVLLSILAYIANKQSTTKTIENFEARPFSQIEPLIKPATKPASLVSPTEVKKAYKLSTSPNAGKGTIAIVNAYSSPTAEKDLAKFNKQFKIRSCTKANKCFRQVTMAKSTPSKLEWQMETALDTQWAHAIAPGAKILLVEAASANGNDLIKAVDFARKQKDVVAISMSWGGNEFPSEKLLEPFFSSRYGATFFAASGDWGHGTYWPAVSANVISVGGTTLKTNSKGSFVSETAWSGSGGGQSKFIKEPSYQSKYKIPKSNKMRAVPDVSYNADPATGFPVYASFNYHGSKGWFKVGGTSAGTPQWAAIRALSGKKVSQANIYEKAAPSKQKLLRDITSGKNGKCGAICSAMKRYDYVTGLGTPLTLRF